MKKKTTTSSTRKRYSTKGKSQKSKFIQKILTKEKWFNVPNVLSISRVLMVGPFIYFAHVQNAEEKALLPLLFIILFFGITDFMDGLIARHFKLKTTLGAYLDPIADKFVIIASLIVMVFYFKFPIWILVIYLIRELITIYFATILFKQRIQSLPNIWGKLAVALMIFLLPMYLLADTINNEYSKTLGNIAEILAYAWFACYFFSGINSWQKYGNKLARWKRKRG